MRALGALALALLAQLCVSVHASVFQRQRVAIQHAERGITTVARRFSAEDSRGLTVLDWRVLQDGTFGYSHRSLVFFLWARLR